MGTIGRAVNDLYGRDLVAWQQWAESREEVSTDLVWSVPMVSYVGSVRAGTMTASRESRDESPWKLALRNYLQSQGLTEEQRRLQSIISLDDAFDRGANENVFEQLTRWCDELHPLDESNMALDLSGLALD